MKLILYGDGEIDPSQEIVANLADEAISGSLLILLVKNIASFDFEVLVADKGQEGRFADF